MTLLLLNVEALERVYHFVKIFCQSGVPFCGFANDINQRWVHLKIH